MGNTKSCVIIDIFSSFDPILSYLGGHLFFWVWSFVPAFIFLSFFWTSYSPYFLVRLISLVFIKGQRNRTTIRWLPIRHVFLARLFFILFSLNLAGLVPYVFRATRHLVLTLRFGFPFWLALIFSGLVWAPTSFLARLLPRGAPAWLNPFLIIVEIIRIFVRPFTLSFRLAANIRAGHIIIILLSFYARLCFQSSIFSGVGILILVLWGYIIFEMGIALIQAYIFCLLLSLYANDHPIR